MAVGRARVVTRFDVLDEPVADEEVVGELTTAEKHAAVPAFSGD